MMSYMKLSFPFLGSRCSMTSLPRVMDASTAVRCLSLTHVTNSYTRPTEYTDIWPTPKRWPMKNLEMYPPQEEGEPRRRATYCHFRANVKYSPKKMWYICGFIRGMTVDEAIKQLSFIPKKGALVMKGMLEDAREIALKDHGFEYSADMHVGEAFSTKGLVIKGYRKHAFFRMGVIEYFHCHIMIRLVEGPPPEDRYNKVMTNEGKFERYMDDLRRRNIKYSL